MTYDDFLNAWERHCEKDSEEPILLDPANFYFNVYNNENEGMVAIVTPKCLWDAEGIVCDQSTANLLMDKLDAFELMESVYEFEGELEHDGDLIKAYLKNSGLEYNPTIEYPY